jgi:phage major head subunit gpT-like protein
MIINYHTITGLTVGFRNEYNKGFAGAAPQWQKVSALIPSITGTNQYPFHSAFPKLREWVGDRQAKNLIAYTYSLLNKPFEGTVKVDRPSIINDQWGVFNMDMQMMGYSAGMHPDELVFGAISSAATDLCYDGQPYLNASHPIVVNGVDTTVSNYDSTPSTNLWLMLDTKKPIKPFIYQKREPYTFVMKTQQNDENVFWRNEYVYGVNGYGAAGYGFWQLAYGSLNTLNETNVDAYYQAMIALKDDEGHPLGVMPDTILVGPSNAVAARNLVKKERLANGESNPLYGAYDIVLTPFLT